MRSHFLKFLIQLWLNFLFVFRFINQFLVPFLELWLKLCKLLIQRFQIFFLFFPVGRGRCDLVFGLLLKCCLLPMYLPLFFQQIGHLIFLRDQPISSQGYFHLVRVPEVDRILFTIEVLQRCVFLESLHKQFTWILSKFIRLNYQFLQRIIFGYSPG